MGLGGIKAVVPVVLTRNSKATSTGIHWQQRSKNLSNDDKKTIKANTKISLFGFSSKKSKFWSIKVQLDKIRCVSQIVVSLKTNKNIYRDTFICQMSKHKRCK